MLAAAPGGAGTGQLGRRHQGPQLGCPGEMIRGESQWEPRRRGHKDSLIVP